MKITTRVLKLHHPTGSPYWQAGEYKIEKPNGEFVNVDSITVGGTSYKIEVHENGIWHISYACGSGYGKIKCNQESFPPVKLVHRHEYDEIDYVGQKLEMSKELRKYAAEMAAQEKEYQQPSAHLSFDRLTDRWWVYELKCRRCGSIKKVFYGHCRDVTWFEFEKAMLQKIQSAEPSHCDFCGKQTVQDVILFSSPHQSHK